MHDVRWLGFEWDALYYASDFFEELYQYAEHLIRTGHAYVDDLTGEQIGEYRGSLDKPGRPSPYRDRPVEESLDLFRRMRQGEFENGKRTLRAKIDIALAQSEPARSGALPHPARAPPSHRRQVVHLSDVRLRARTVRRAREDHALDLHARVRDPSAALRLVPRSPPGAEPARARSSSRA
jgi:glutamyl/glutaminyl-tRNA synthetase